GKLDGAARRLAQPERNGRRCSACVVDHHLAATYMLDPPGGIAQEKNIAAIGLDREVLVQRPDQRSVLIVNDNAVAGDFWDGAAASNGREPRSLSRSQPAVDAVAVHVSAPPAALWHDAFAQHVEHRFVILTAKIP